MSETLIQTMMRGDYPPDQASGTLRLRGAGKTPAVDAYPELEAKGYTVIKGAIPQAKAAEYVDRMYSWLEGFGKGFKREDRETWHIDQLPPFHRGGLFSRYGANHEQFTWDIRGEPGVVQAFEKIWGTSELLVSFDAINMSLPLPSEELAGFRSKAWPHVDQSPNRRWKHCVQGIANLEVNGPKDGGLMVLEGSSRLFNQYFDEHPSTDPEGFTWRDVNWYDDAQLQWFFDKGCKWVKVEAEPGDLILWDSRTIHYGAPATGDRPRIATYVCYKPSSEIEPGMRDVRAKAMTELIGTTHDPLLFRMTGSKIDAHLMEDERVEPVTPPVLTERMRQLAGVKAY